MKLKRIVNQQIYTSPLSKLPTNGKCIINTINPHSYNESKKDQLFTEALISSDVLLPDGFGILLASKILVGKKIKKIAGADIHQYLLEQANVKEQKIFYLGAAPKTLDLIKKRIQKEFPNISIACFSPPFKAAFSNEDTIEMLSKVNAFKPDILFVGMTAPKQEKWVYINQNKIDAQVIVSIGAVFDFYAGTINRAPQFMINAGFEWFYRLVKEPKRMWRRYLIGNTKFMWYILQEKVNSIILKK